MESLFFPAIVRQNLQANLARQPWARKLRDHALAYARPWLERSDQDLWAMIFGPTITRSWMVWSDGHCPVCQKPVTMYNWKMDAMKRPWKTWCPHCRELFPKNDFAAYYRSGLDQHGVFDPGRANRSLLFNTEHPEPDQPLYKFGVDDGEGYVDEAGNRWRFIGAYLIYGQWKQLVLGGIRALAEAHVFSGQTVYARKAAIMLDRVADLYPAFDFATQGRVYEDHHVAGRNGYVSTWHDACEETRELAMAYDMVMPSLRDDRELVRFLSAKARQYGLASLKTSYSEIRRNIEVGILEDALANQPRIHSNYPRREIALILIKAILGHPRQDVHGLIAIMIERATAVDGVTGEKGLANYSASVIQSLADFLALWNRAEEGFLKRYLELYPVLRQTYRFHIDTWCLRKFYPLVGDTGWFAQAIGQYRGVLFRHPNAVEEGYHGIRPLVEAPLAPSMYAFLWNLYQLTGEPVFAQVIYLANGNTLEGLPHDLFITNPAAVREGVARVVAELGEGPQVGSLNKEQWHLAILRSGRGQAARAAWLHYEAGGGHGHFDGMNLGLFAFGLDLMPELGYPPVQFGGWQSTRARWYKMSAAHNTVVVDGENQAVASGRCTLWAEGEMLRAVRASAPDLLPEPVAASCRQFERMVVQVDMPEPERFYLVEIFRVAGGRDHAKFMHSSFAELTTEGLVLVPGEAYGHETQMRDFQWDLAPRPGWSAEWRILDSEGRLPQGRNIRLRYTDFTSGIQAASAEGWICRGGYGDAVRHEGWIPRLLIRRRTDDRTLASTFVGVIEPFEDDSAIKKIRRLPVTDDDGRAYPENTVALEVTHADGMQDLLLAADPENPLGQGPSLKTARGLLQPDWDLRLQGELCLVRRQRGGEIAYMAAVNAASLRVAGLEIRGRDSAGQIVEWSKSEESKDVNDP